MSRIEKNPGFEMLVRQEKRISEIEQRIHHSETAVKRYIQDFSKIILLKSKGFSVDQIRMTTGFSNRLIGEYINLYKKYQQQGSQRLETIFNPKKTTGNKEHA